MSKVTLTDLVNLQNETSAVATLNNNNATIEAAFDNTLSRDGTSPNTMNAAIDLNSHQILNLSPGVLSTDAVNFGQLDAASVAAGNVPIGGTVGQALTKNSSTNYDMSWLTPSSSTSAAYTVRGNATGSSATTTDISIPALTQKASPVSADKIMIADSAASNALKYALLSSIATIGSVSSIATNTGAFTLSNGITNATNDIRIDIGNLPGVVNNGAAAAGKVGELLSTTVISGSAVALTTGVDANIAVLNLTAGDWDVSGTLIYTGGVTTTLGQTRSCISNVSATVDSTPGRRVDTYLSNTTAFSVIDQYVNLPVTRVALNAPANIYLVGRATFAVSTCAGYGIIRARRVR